MDNPKPAPLGIVIAFGVATVIAGVLLAWKCHRYDEAQRAEERVRQLCEDAQEANNQILQARSVSLYLHTVFFICRR